MSISLLIITASATSTDYLAVNITHLVVLGIFAIVSYLNLRFVNIKNYANILMYSTVIFEISIPTLLKLSFIATPKPFIMMNESVDIMGYFLFIILSLFQNNKKLTITAGIIAIIEYTILLLIAIFLVKLPVKTGIEKYGYVLIDDEIAKIILIGGFTVIAVLVLKNLQNFAYKALQKEEESNEKAERLEKIFIETKEINNSLFNIISRQKEVSKNLYEIAHDEAAMSEELSSIYEEQTASNELIQKNTTNQTKQTEKMISIKND